MPHITDRFYNSRWGVFTHYLGHGATTAEEYNATVNSFDVKKVAKALHDVGAGYYFITIMQGKRFMLAPNETYNKITGYKPGEACAERDLIAELIPELDKYGIDLYLYYTGDGPHIDEEIGRKFGFTAPRENVSEEFVRKWASVLSEYAERYKGKVRGWWIDGCYPYFGYTPELLNIYNETLKSIDPNVGVAFNVHGVKEELIKNHPEEDFTPGEFNSLWYVPKERFIDGAQAHLLMPIGPMWGSPGCNYTREFVADYVRRVRAAGGIPTFDALIYPDGTFDEAQKNALMLKDLV